MTVDDRRKAIQARIAARLRTEINDQRLKRMGIMRNANTLRRVLRAEDDYRLSSLIAAADGVNCEVEITFVRRDNPSERNTLRTEVL